MVKEKQRFCKINIKMKQVLFVIGGDGSHRAAQVIYEEVKQEVIESAISRV